MKEQPYYGMKALLRKEQPTVQYFEQCHCREEMYATLFLQVETASVT